MVFYGFVGIGGFGCFLVVMKGWFFLIFGGVLYFWEFLDGFGWFWVVMVDCG